jgi:hypothetical protein
MILHSQKDLGDERSHQGVPKDLDDPGEAQGVPDEDQDELD